MALLLDKWALRRYIERSLQDLPPMPAVVAKIIEATDRSTSSATELETLISSDQALAAKVIRIVNSAYYGLEQQVGSTRHAVVILGFRQVRNIALSMAAMSLLKSGAARLRKTQERFWRHSFAAGAAAGLIADRKLFEQAERDTAFVAALLHDIGKLFLCNSFTDLYTEIMSRAASTGAELPHAEEQVLGISHAEVGRVLASTWRFPEGLAGLIGRHHEEPFAGDGDRVLAAVQAADRLANLAGYATHPTEQRASVGLPAEVSAWLGVEGDAEAEMVESLHARVAGAEELFGLL